mmetsp:Transcript_83675/g.255696  ORF Transcript_83675/g.255696 Transcript_83675/m.255696 type:complete len:277 (+) Transcript_83675:376-1206(+)
MLEELRLGHAWVDRVKSQPRRLPVSPVHLLHHHRAGELAQPIGVVAVPILDALQVVQPLVRIVILPRAGIQHPRRARSAQRRQQFRREDHRRQRVDRQRVLELPARRAEGHPPLALVVPVRRRRVVQDPVDGREHLLHLRGVPPDLVELEEIALERGNSVGGLRPALDHQLPHELLQATFSPSHHDHLAALPDERRGRPPADAAGATRDKEDPLAQRGQAKLRVPVDRHVVQRHIGVFLDAVRPEPRLFEAPSILRRRRHVLLVINGRRLVGGGRA